MLSSPWRMHLSWLALAVGVVWGISLAQAAGSGTSVVATALVYGYLIWSFYWAGPSFFNWWRRAVLPYTGRMDLFSFFWALKMSIAVAVLFWGGILFCTLGGGIYQFSQHWKLMRSQA